MNALFKHELIVFNFLMKYSFQQRLQVLQTLQDISKMLELHNL